MTFKNHKPVQYLFILFLLGGCSDIDINSYYFYVNKIISREDVLKTYAIDAGRELFYDTILSLNYDLSCSSCHIQKYAFTDGRRVALAKNSEKTFNTISLANVGFVERLFWEGRVSELEGASLAPIVNHREMGLRFLLMVNRIENSPKYQFLLSRAYGNSMSTIKKVAYSLAAFQRTLISFNSKYDKYLKGEAQLDSMEIFGKYLFFTMPNPKEGVRGGACFLCHKEGLFSSTSSDYSQFKNNGISTIDDIDQGIQRINNVWMDLGKFKIPTLRNIAVTAPYMHDGRLSSIEEVIDHYSDGIQESFSLDSILRFSTNDTTNEVLGLHFTNLEKKALKRFLLTLTDTSFLTDKRFSKPSP